METGEVFFEGVPTDEHDPSFELALADGGGLSGTGGLVLVGEEFGEGGVFGKRGEGVVYSCCYQVWLHPT